MRVRTIELPGDLPPLNPHQYVECLGDCRGKLYFAYLYDDSQIRIWVLDDYYGGKWVLRHTTSVQALQQEFREEIQSLTFVLFHPDCDAVYVRINSVIYSYHLITRTLRIIRKKDMGHASYFCAYPFSPSLYSVNMHEYDVPPNHVHQLDHKESSS